MTELADAPAVIRGGRYPSIMYALKQNKKMLILLCYMICDRFSLILRNFAHSLAGLADKDNSLTPSLIAIPRIVLIVWEHLPSQFRTSYRLPCPCVECVEMITGSIAFKASQHPYPFRATWTSE